MTPASLRRVGETLYLRFSVGRMARDLGCSPRTIQRYLAGETMPEDLALRLGIICKERSYELLALARELGK